MKKEDPEQYARFCEDDDSEPTQNHLPMKRKAEDSGPSAYTLVGQAAATMAGLGGGIGTTMAGIPVTGARDLKSSPPLDLQTALKNR